MTPQLIIVIKSDEIEFFCRPQLLHWLVNHSDAAQRKMLKGMLLNIVEHHAANQVSWSRSKVAPMAEERRLSVFVKIEGICSPHNTSSIDPNHGPMRA